MSVTFTQLSQTIKLSEKVKVDSGEKIVKTEKVGRKKNIEVTISTKSGKFFVYFDGEKYAGQYRTEKDADKVVKDYLKLVGEELQENRAKRDAFKAMGRRKGKDSADVDDFATDDDKKAADKNIMMQLRKAVSLRGMKPIEFADGKKAKINPKDAEKLLAIYDKLKPASKLQLQTVLAKSKRDFDKAVQKLKENEYFDESIEEGKMKQISMYIDDIVTAMNKDRTLKPFAKKFKADAEKSKDPKKSLEKILPDYIPGKQVAGLLNMGEEILSNDELEYIAEMLEELQEGTWALPDTPQKKQGLKKAMSKPIKLGKGGDDAISVVGAFIGDDELYDDLGVAGDKNPNGDARPIVSKWMKKNFKGSWSKYAIEEVELDERRFTPKQIKMAIGVASDKRYKGGNMTGAVKAIEKIARGLSKDKQVAAVLRRQNEDLEEAGLPPHLAKLFDKDGNFKDPKKQKVFDRMMGDGIGREITKKMGRIKFRVDADSAKKKVMVYVDQNDEKDAQRALKNHPAYVSGALRVIPEGEFTPHVMYDPKTGKAYKAEKPEDHERMSKMGYTHEKPKEVKEAIKYTHVAVDAKGKIIGFAGGKNADADAKDMARRNKGVVHKLKKPMAQKVGDMEINRPFNPVLKANMSFKDFSRNED
jgi:hypothetical protein